MKKLSYWAKENPWKTRIIIILLHAAIITLALFTGETFNALGIQFPGWILFLFLALFIMIVFLYPSRHQKILLGRDLFYIRQKSCDFLLALSSFCMIGCMANKTNGGINLLQPVSASSINPVNKTPTASEILASLQFRDKSTLTRAEIRILKKEFKMQFKNYMIAKIKGYKAEGDQALLIILAIVAALGLISLLGLLACSISCSGSTGLAIAVFILGTAGIVWGLITIIRSINRKGKSK